MNDKVIQTIIMRKKFPTSDGGEKSIRTGKYCAQASHASMAFLSNKWRQGRWAYQGIAASNGQAYERAFYPEPLTDEEAAWIEGSFTKICLYVDTEQELRDLYEAAKTNSLTAHLIEDSGLTEFNNEPTITALAIGPHFKSKIDPITKDLRLF